VQPAPTQVREETAVATFSKDGRARGRKIEREPDLPTIERREVFPNPDDDAAARETSRESLQSGV